MKKIIIDEAMEDRSVFHRNHTDSMPNPTLFPSAGNYYDLYRLGVHFAKQPDHNPDSPSGPVGEHPFTASYTDEEQEIVNRAAKLCGFKPRKLGSKYSEEGEDVHKHSPVNHNSGMHIRKRHWRKD